MNQIDLLPRDAQQNSKPVSKPIEPTIRELKDAVYITWLRTNGGTVMGYPCNGPGPGPSKFRQVWQSDPRGLLVWFFEDESSSFHDPSSRARASGIVAWLRENEISEQVANYDPTGGGRFGDEPCCDLDPLYCDREAMIPLVAAHGRIRDGLIAAGWGPAATEPYRVCASCQQHVDQSKP